MIHRYSAVEADVQIGEFKDLEKAVAMAKLVPALREHRSDVHRLQREIVACLVGAGFCAFGLIWAIALGRESWPGPGASTSWYLSLIFCGVAGASLSTIAWAKFKLHDVTIRAGERAYLIFLLERCAKEDITFSAADIVDFFRHVPDSAP